MTHFTSFSSAEQAALADLAPIRPTPLPIEILAAGGPRALRLAHACPFCNGCVNLDEMRCDNCGVWLRKGKA